MLREFGSEISICLERHMEIAGKRFAIKSVFPKLKNSLIEMLLEEDDDKKGMLYDKFIKEVKRNVVPVIKGRAFERDKGIRTSKYSKALRRAL